jgi:hypothetical protein
VKWTLTSPDGLGDFLIRLPWLLAMKKAGWQLQLLARQPTVELAELAGLDADTVCLSLSPYSKTARGRRFPYRRELEAVRRSSPEVIFFGPSQPTFLEEQFVAQRQRGRIGGFRLSEGFWPGEGIMDPRELVACHDFSVVVEPGHNEFERNRLAAEHFLGPIAAEELRPFRFDASAGGFPRPAGLPDDYIVVCAGYRRGDYFAGWGTGSWAEGLRGIEALTGLPFVFVGGADEERAHAEILSRMAHPHRHHDLTGKTQRIAALCGVIAGSDAFVGKDCGPMHLANALGRPVLSVFGGGHWPRFLPRGSRSVVLTARVPCRGCDWRCHLEQPSCVTGVPTGRLAEGWLRLQSSPDEETVVLETELSAASLSAITDPGNHVQRVHEERRRGLKRDREACLQPWFTRLLGSFRRKSDG